MRWTEGHIAASERPWRQRPCRGRSAWHACGWVSREPGRPRRLHLKDRRGAGTGSPSPRPRTEHLPSTGAQPQVLGWYRCAKATKRGGTGGEESECLIVPAKRGNRVHEPRGGKGAPTDRPVGGNDGQHAEVGLRLTETTTDSRAGRTSAGDGVHEPGSLHRHGVSPSGVRRDAKGRGRRTGRTNGGRRRRDWR